MKREFIEGMKCLGKIGVIVLEGLLESALTYEATPTYEEEENDLEEKWRRELYYYSDERLEQELKNCFLYNWSVDYDGRCKCIDRIAEFKAKNNYKVC